MDTNQYETFPDENVNKALTKREYFAAMAMQGMLGGNRLDITAKAGVKAAVKIADLLIKELNKKK